MITAIVPDARDARDVQLLLTALVPAAAEGLVRQVLLLDAGLDAAAREIADDAGADILAASLAEAARAARGEWLLVLPQALRLRRGWGEVVAEHLEAGGGPARIRGVETASWAQRLLRPGATGALVRRDGVGEGASLAALVRQARGRILS